jgi:hypothetical protein
MRVEEKGEYETIWGNKVRIQWSFDLEEMLMYYESELSEILNISHKSEEEREKILRNQNVVYWITDTTTMSSWLRHSKSGKCLWWNTKWVMWKWEALKKKLQIFDIKTDTKEETK